MSAVKCGICNREHTRRRIIKQFPLKDITSKLPEHLKDTIKEYLCINKILLRRGSGEWVEDICNNHILSILKNI